MSVHCSVRRWARVGVVAVIGLVGITTSTAADAAIVIGDDGSVNPGSPRS